MRDGHLNKCKDCARRDARSNRKKNLEKHRAYDRERGNRMTVEAIRAYRERFPERYRAHNAVGRAVRVGKLIKPASCEQCGARNRLHGHHDDYSKPLEVKWLCPGCHAAEHEDQGRFTHG